MAVTPGRLAAISTQPPLCALRRAFRQMAADRSVIALLHSLGQMFEVAPGVRGLKRGVTGPFERFDVALYGLGLAYLLYRVVGLDKHQAWFVVAESEDVDHGDDAGGRPVFETLDVQPHVAAA